MSEANILMGATISMWLSEHFHYGYPTNSVPRSYIYLNGSTDESHALTKQKDNKNSIP